MKIKLLLLFIIFFSSNIFSQNISVNTSGAANSTSSMFEVLQPSTANNTTGIFSRRSGALAAANYIAYGIWSEVICTGTTPTNIAGYFSASGATNNYAIIVPSTGGRVGIGTTSPATTLNVVADDGLQIGRASNTDQTLTIIGGEGSGYATLTANYGLRFNAAFSSGFGGTIDLQSAGVSKVFMNTTGALSFNGGGYGTAGQVLTSNGNAPPSWQAASGGSGAGSCMNNWQLYISGATSGMLGTGTPGSFTVPASVTIIKVCVWGGGGGGGGGGNGSGGGGGGYAEGTLSVTAGNVYQITIGGFGGGGASGSAGGGGGTTCFSSAAACGGTVYFSATGGGGGATGGGAGGTSGIGSGGYLNTTLGMGGAGAGTIGNHGAGGGGCGYTASGTAAGGGGGLGGGNSGVATTSGSSAAANSGAGGGGAYTGGFGGGNGGAGKIIVYW